MENEIFRVGNGYCKGLPFAIQLLSAAVRQDSMQLTAFGNWDSTIFC